MPLLLCINLMPLSIFMLFLGFLLIQVPFWLCQGLMYFWGALLLLSFSFQALPYRHSNHCALGDQNVRFWCRDFLFLLLLLVSQFTLFFKFSSCHHLILHLLNTYTHCLKNSARFFHFLESGGSPQPSAPFHLVFLASGSSSATSANAFKWACMIMFPPTSK